VNMKMGLAILFGIPAILLAIIYYSLGNNNYWHLDINNYWHLFLFWYMAMIMYIPGMLLLHFAYIHHVRNKIKREFED
jgi:hypothetical protein